MWPDLLLVHGKPRRPQSQGSVERCNSDVKDMFTTWLSDNKSTDWTTGLKFVQFMKNTSHHSGINQTPYKALFGCDPRSGLRSTTLPTEVLEKLVTEEDLEAAFGTDLHSRSTDDVEEQPQHEEPAVTEHAVAEPAAVEPAAVDPAAVEPTAAEPAAAELAGVDSAPIEHAAVELDAVEPAADTDLHPTTSHVSPVGHRKRAREGLMKQAERMVKRSRIINVAGKVGDNVTVPVPLVDRGRGDSRNIMGVIVDRDENDLYRIAVKGGVLDGKYSRNQFDLCSQILLLPSDVCQNVEISLRNAVQQESRCGGQGFLKCNCSGAIRCQTNRCKCFKAKVQCNSRCHSSMTCQNKH